MKTIFLVHPAGALDSPEGGRHSLTEPSRDERDMPLALRLYELNASYLMVRFGRVDKDLTMQAYVLSTLRHVRSGDSKCLLLALKLLELLIEKMLTRPGAGEEEVKLLASRLDEHLKQDLLACSHDLEAESLPSHERPENQRPLGGDPPR